MAPPASKRQTSCRKRPTVLTSTLPSLTTEDAMSVSSTFFAAPSGPAVSTGRTEVAAHQVFWVLRVGFTVLPRFGGLVVAAWLAGIIVNLLLLGGYHDVALRDFGLLLASLGLARLAWA